MLLHQRRQLGPKRWCASPRERRCSGGFLTEDDRRQVERQSVPQSMISASMPVSLRRLETKT